MKIIVVGHTGFVGRAVYKHLRMKRFVIGGLNSNSSYEDRACDILINCAGNAKKFLASKNYIEARSIEDGILLNVKKINAKKVIHISSMDAETMSNYGLLKKYAERIISNFIPDFCILRLSGLIGEGLSKNVVFDLLNNNQLYVKPNSTYNFINTSVVAEIIEYLISNWQAKEIINIAANKSISVREIAKILNVRPQIRSDATVEHCFSDSRKLQTFFKTNSSQYYTSEYVKTLRDE